MADSQKQSYYRVAGLDVASDLEIDHLNALSRGVITVTDASQSVKTNLGHLDTIYNAPGQFSNGERHVRSLSNGDTDVLQVEGLGDFILSGDGRIESTIAPKSDRSFLQEVLVGPPLILQMAKRDVYCLHASAARIAGKVCVFLGDSGQGKSTIANFTMTNWVRISDDVLPVSINSSTQVVVRPHFPQLKLSADEQYPASEAEQLPLNIVLVLNPIRDPRGSAEIQFHKLDVTDAALAIVRHTVASKLFPSGLLKKHLEIAATLVSYVDVYVLTYPMTTDKLPALRQSIIRFVNTIS